MLDSRRQCPAVDLGKRALRASQPLLRRAFQMRAAVVELAASVVEQRLD
jgi:hypothetical protein